MTTAARSQCHSSSSMELMTPPRRSPAEVWRWRGERWRIARVSVWRKGQVETEKEEMQTKQEVKDFMLEYPHIALVRSQEEMEVMMRS